ncbi:YciI family protein [Vibrio sp. WJH972]
MISWQDYKTEAKERGALALEVFVVESKPNTDLEVIKHYLPSHLAYQAELEASGSLMLAGPMSDSTGESLEGAGLIVYRASTLEKATQLAEADPMHSSGARVFKIRRWLINEGSMQIDIRLSAQVVTLSGDESN